MSTNSTDRLVTALEGHVKDLRRDKDRLLNEKETLAKEKESLVKEKLVVEQELNQLRGTLISTGASQPSPSFNHTSGGLRRERTSVFEFEDSDDMSKKLNELKSMTTAVEAMKNVSLLKVGKEEQDGGREALRNFFVKKLIDSNLATPAPNGCHLRNATHLTQPTVMKPDLTLHVNATSSQIVAFVELKKCSETLPTSCFFDSTDFIRLANFIDMNLLDIPNPYMHGLLTNGTSSILVRGERGARGHRQRQSVFTIVFAGRDEENICLKWLLSASLELLIAKPIKVFLPSWNMNVELSYSNCLGSGQHCFAFEIDLGAQTNNNNNNSEETHEDAAGAGGTTTSSQFAVMKYFFSKDHYNFEKEVYKILSQKNVPFTSTMFPDEMQPDPETRCILIRERGIKFLANPSTRWNLESFPAALSTEHFPDPKEITRHQVCQLFEGLQKMHAAGVIQGDIFHGNIFCHPNGVDAFLNDWSLATIIEKEPRFAVNPYTLRAAKENDFLKLIKVLTELGTETSNDSGMVKWLTSLNIDVMLE